MSVLVASVAIGSVLGWAAVPRFASPPHVWLLHMIGMVAAIVIADHVSPLFSNFAFAGAATGFSGRALIMAGLYRRRV